MIYNIFGVSIALVHFLVPYFVFVIIGAIRSIPKSCEEAARDLGANPFRVFYRVTLPLSIPGIMTATTLVYSLALSSFVFPLLLGGGRVQFVSDAIYSKIVVSFDRPYAAAASAVYLVVALGTIVVCYRLQRLVVRGVVPKGSAA
jgi:putative spermidine/putrescine transport system permease protein